MTVTALTHSALRDVQRAAGAARIIKGADDVARVAQAAGATVQCVTCTRASS